MTEAILFRHRNDPMYQIGHVFKKTGEKRQKRRKMIKILKQLHAFPKKNHLELRKALDFSMQSATFIEKRARVAKWQTQQT